jgi:RimJ/RimL family protein N-acetyltransferase/dihydrofolate reductase
VNASVFVGTSLDGFIARADGSFDFLPSGGGEPHGYEEFMATVDALVIGRKTFETALGLGGWPYGPKPVFVLSSRPIATAPPGAVVERMSGAPADIGAQLEARGIRHIYVDGGITIQRFLQAGLIHRLIVTRVPVLIGTGIPLFGPVERDIALTHIATRQYASGLVQSEYAVAPSASFDRQPVLRGEILELRPLRADDFAALFRVAADPLIWEQHPERDRYQEATFRAFFEEALASGGALVALDRANGRIIGSSRYHGYDAERSVIEIGWTLLARAYWGGRYNGEMKKLMLEHAFRSVERVVFVIGPDNRRSQRAVEKIGGVRAGTRTDAHGRERVVYELTPALYAPHH